MSLDYLTSEEISEQLGVSSGTVRSWLRQGKILGIKKGRMWLVNKNNIFNFLQKKKKQNEEDALSFLIKNVGVIEAPEDWASEHDHYIYGTPKHPQKY